MAGQKGSQRWQGRHLLTSAPDSVDTLSAQLEATKAELARAAEQQKINAAEAKETKDDFAKQLGLVPSFPFPDKLCCGCFVGLCVSR